MCHFLAYNAVFYIYLICYRLDICYSICRPILTYLQCCHHQTNMFKWPSYKSRKWIKFLHIYKLFDVWSSLQRLSNLAAVCVEARNNVCNSHITQLLSHSCCHTAAVTQLLSHSCCHTAAVTCVYTGRSPGHGAGMARCCHRKIAREHAYYLYCIVLYMVGRAY